MVEKESKNKKIERKVVESESVDIMGPNWKIIYIPVKGHDGIALITQRQDADYIEETITGREQGKIVEKKFRNYDEEYERCFHRLPGKKNKYGFPASGYYLGMLFTAMDKHLKGIDGTDVKRHIRVLAQEGDLVPFEYKELKRVVSNPKRPKGSPDTRHRPWFYGWTAELCIRYNADVFNPSSIVNLVAHAGVCSGIGTWRPSSPKGPGPNGTYEIDKSRLGKNLEE